jgi:hypothetical protein
LYLKIFSIQYMKTIFGYLHVNVITVLLFVLNGSNIYIYIYVYKFLRICHPIGEYMEVWFFKEWGWNFKYCFQMCTIHIFLLGKLFDQLKSDAILYTWISEWSYISVTNDNRRGVYRTQLCTKLLYTKRLG